MKWEFCKHLRLVVFWYCKRNNQSCHNVSFQSLPTQVVIWFVIYHPGELSRINANSRVSFFLFTKTSQAKEKQRPDSDFHFTSLIHVLAQNRPLRYRKKQFSWVLIDIAILCSLKLLRRPIACVFLETVLKVAGITGKSVARACWSLLPPWAWKKSWELSCIENLWNS